MTRSERLFDRYCEALGYKVEGVGTRHRRTPDRVVNTPAGPVVVEVKELTPNEDDLRYMRELSDQGWSSRGRTPGDRVFEKIRSAAPQLKVYKDCNVPCVLVLYDNVRSGGWRVGDAYLEGSMIDFGMYGLQTVILASSEAAPEAPLVAVGSGRGGRRQMSEDNRVYISAVQVLSEWPHSPSEAFTLTYHNYFAICPLPYSAFRGPHDRHFVKPDHPERTPQQWREVGLLSESSPL